MVTKVSGLLADRVAIVTGGGQGIGLAITQSFLVQGATVVVADLDGDRAGTAAGELGGPVEAVTCDVTDEVSVTSLVERVVDRHGRVDVFVNNAGITRDGMMHKLSLDDFRTVTDVHLQGTWLCSRAALVRGHENLPVGGQQTSPLVDTKRPH